MADEKKLIRTRGTGELNNNYDVIKRAPMDARTLVPSYDALTNINNWYKANTTTLIIYNGMLVVVADTTDPSNSGLYMFMEHQDKYNPNQFHPENIENWHKLSSLDSSELEGIVGRVAELETFKSNTEAKLAEFETAIDDLEKKEYVKPYMNRSAFPAVGESGVIYVDATAEISYIYTYEKLEDMYHYYRYS